MTIEEWAAMPEDEPGELVDGYLVEEEVPDLPHERLVIRLGRVLDIWLSPNGFVFGSDAKYTVRPNRGRKPDLTVYLNPDGSRLPRSGVVRVPPDIAVEVVSSTPRDERRDRIEKMDEYAAFGIRFYGFSIRDCSRSRSSSSLTGATRARHSPPRVGWNPFPAARDWSSTSMTCGARSRASGRLPNPSGS
jgi:hypothetical protein